MLQWLISSNLLICFVFFQVKLVSTGQKRIVGGVETTIEEFPLIVSLRYGGNHRCGGTIFTFDYVIVAANCILGLPTHDLSIVGGVTDRTQNGTFREVKNVIIHEDYDAYYRRNDIALLALKKAFEFSSKIQSAQPIREGEEIKPGTRAYVAGWGGSIDGQNIQDTLHFTDLYLVSNQDCSEMYRPFNNITNDMICASPLTGQRGICYGDYGGPLLVANRLYGIASWAIGCADKKFPSVFVRIPAFRGWIRRQLEQG